jgi:hypothetical protein
MSRKSILVLAIAVMALGLAIAGFFVLRPSKPTAQVQKALSGPASIPLGRAVALAPEPPTAPGQTASKSVAATSPASFRPSRDYTLDERTLAVVPRPVEGIVVADVVGLDRRSKTAILRAREFSLTLQIDIADPPAHLTMPPGSLFRGELSDALLGRIDADAVVRKAFTKGSTTRFTVRVGGKRGSPRVEVLSVGPNRGGSGK